MTNILKENKDEIAKNNTIKKNGNGKDVANVVNF